MKINIKYAVLSLLAVAGVTMTSCSSDEHFDVVGNPNNLVYFKTNTGNVFTGTIAHTPVGDFGSLDASFTVKLQRAVETSATVQIVPDEDLVKAYNEANGTSYVALPVSAVTLTNQQVTIPAGEVKGTEPFSVALNESALASLTESAYMLAVRIVPNNGDMKGSEERGIGYIIVNTEEKLVKDISDVSEMTGTLLTDYTGWTATYDTGASINVAEIFDGNLENGPQLRADGADGHSKVIIVDMKASKKVSGLRVARYYKSYYGGWWYEEYYFSGVKIEVSDDGINWSEAGTADEGFMPKQDGYQHIAFYGGVPTRYLRLSIESGSSSVSSLAELGVYTAE